MNSTDLYELFGVKLCDDVMGIVIDYLDDHRAETAIRMLRPESPLNYGYMEKVKRVQENFDILIMRANGNFPLNSYYAGTTIKDRKRVVRKYDTYLETLTHFQMLSPYNLYRLHLKVFGIFMNKIFNLDVYGHTGEQRRSLMIFRFISHKQPTKDTVKRKALQWMISNIAMRCDTVIEHDIQPEYQYPTAGGLIHLIDVLTYLDACLATRDMSDSDYDKKRMREVITTAIYAGVTNVFRDLPALEPIS